VSVAVADAHERRDRVVTDVHERRDRVVTDVHERRDRVVARAELSPAAGLAAVARRVLVAAFELHARHDALRPAQIDRAANLRTLELIRLRQDDARAAGSA
jgi:hypothetical protein